MIQGLFNLGFNQGLNPAISTVLISIMSFAIKSAIAFITSLSLLFLS